MYIRHNIRTSEPYLQPEFELGQIVSTGVNAYQFVKFLVDFEAGQAVQIDVTNNASRPFDQYTPVGIHPVGVVGFDARAGEYGFVFRQGGGALGSPEAVAVQGSIAQGVGPNSKVYANNVDEPGRLAANATSARYLEGVRFLQGKDANNFSFIQASVPMYSQEV